MKFESFVQMCNIIVYDESVNKEEYKDIERYLKAKVIE